MNPTVILVVVLLWGTSVGGAFWYGTGVGKDGEIANQSENKDLIEATRAKAQEGAADAIAKIKVTNTTIRGRTDTIIRDNPVYRECLHSPDGMRNINEALTGTAGATGDSKLSGADPAK